MHEKLDLAEPALALRLEQARRWRNHDRAQAEEYLARHPELNASPEYALEVVYGELLLREEDGETPQVEEFLKRFPQFAAQVRRLFESACGGPLGVRGQRSGAARLRACAGKWRTGRN